MQEMSTLPKRTEFIVSKDVRHSYHIVMSNCNRCTYFPSRSDPSFNEKLASPIKVTY